MLPGHWLLEFGLAAALANGAAILLYSLVRGPYDNPPIAYWTPFHMAKSPNLTEVYHQATGWGLGVLASLAFCWHLRRHLPWHWLAVFLGFLLAAMILAGGHLLDRHPGASYGKHSVIGPWCRHPCMSTVPRSGSARRGPGRCHLGPASPLLDRWVALAGHLRVAGHRPDSDNYIYDFVLRRLDIRLRPGRSSGGVGALRSQNRGEETA